MKKYVFSLLLLVAFVAAVTLSGSAIAGGQCCSKGAQASCAPSSDNAKATTTGVSTTAVKATVVKAGAVACNSTAQCGGKPCGSCKPGGTCEGKPCGKCDQQECKRSCEKSTSHSKTTL